MVNVTHPPGESSGGAAHAVKSINKVTNILKMICLNLMKNISYLKIFSKKDSGNQLHADYTTVSNRIHVLECRQALMYNRSNTCRKGMIHKKMKKTTLLLLLAVAVLLPISTAHAYSFRVYPTYIRIGLLEFFNNRSSITIGNALSKSQNVG